VPIHHAVLALLSEGPSYGYELKSQFEQAIGPQWGGLNIGHLYQILDRLERDGNLTRSHLTQSSRPDRTLYTLTASGRQELSQWAAEPSVRAGFRDELFLKLFAASRLGTQALARLVAAQRGACLSEIGALTRLRAQHADEPLVELLIDAAISHTNADLQVVESASGRLAPIAKAARAGR
jgi:DNA-binding PadR family transcriptional regulator